jgi:hypothetical protein
MLVIEAWEFERKIDNINNKVEVIVLSNNYTKEVIENGEGGVLGRWRKVKIKLKDGIVIEKETWSSQNSLEIHYKLLGFVDPELPPNAVVYYD